MKGGSWSLKPHYAKIKSRIYSSIFNSGEYGGFRLAISAILDPITGEYVPEPSPFVDRHLRAVKEFSANDLRQFYAAHLEKSAMAVAVATGCGFVEAQYPSRRFPEA
jgi:hypothetical protein